MNADELDIAALLRVETDNREFKANLNWERPKGWLKSVSAFSNSSGGKILIGVDDHGAMVGICNPQLTVDKLSELIGNSIDPLPDYSVDVVEHEGKVIVLLEVFPGDDCPYFYMRDGVQQAFIRSGSSSVPASGQQLRSLAMRGSNTHYDELISTHKKEDYSFDILKATYYERTRSTFEESDFESLGLITKDGFLTNAGVLLADQWILRTNRIFCTRWKGLHKSSSSEEVLDDHEFEGCLLRLLREGLAFVDRNNLKPWKKITGPSRIANHSYVERVVEEALVNALIHRDYTIGGAEITIFVFDDRLEITSPGSKVDGRLPEDVDVTTVSSERRNPIIADLFQRMELMERRGTGLKLIRERTELAPNYKPEFEPQFIDDGRNFKVILLNMNYDAEQVTPQVTPQVNKLLRVLGEEEFSLKELMQMLGLSDRMSFLRAYIQPALDARIIERTIPDKPNSRLQKYRRAGSSKNNLTN